MLYIGQSSNLKARIGSYRHVSPEKHPRRTLRLVHRIARIEWRECTTANEAMELERVLLLERRPPFNRAGVWQGDPWWLTVDAVDGNLHLGLKREEGGIGPLPSAFRYVFGSLVRYVYRAAFPSMGISSFPHGLFDSRVPLSCSLLVADVEGVAGMITQYVAGRSSELLDLLGSVAPALSQTEQEYWKEEIKRLRKWVRAPKNGWCNNHPLQIPKNEKISSDSGCTLVQLVQQRLRKRCCCTMHYAPGKRVQQCRMGVLHLCTSKVNSVLRLSDHIRRL